MDASAGDIVECINDQVSQPGQLMLLIKGQLYRVVECCLTASAKRPGYKLEGVVHPADNQTLVPYTRTRFRKIDGDKKEWLETLKKHQPADGLVDA